MPETSCKNMDNCNLEHSFYQMECIKYYKVFRDIHTQVFINADRIKAEKTKKRYHGGNVQGIRNLYTFVNLLSKFLKNKKDIKGIDYSCASHFFVNDAVCELKWDVIGYDMDFHAIQDAWKRYPNSRNHYQHWNLLKNKMPEQDESKDFVFCNALIQHFDTEEVCIVFQDISRVLRKGGIFLIIFKRNIYDWKRFSKETGLSVRILDDKEGRVEIEDRFMKNALKSLTPTQRKKINANYRSGLRLFHVYGIDYIMKIAKENHLKIYKNISFHGQKMDRAVFTYLSGKGIPTAALFFIKE